MMLKKLVSSDVIPRYIERADLIKLVQAAIGVESFRFARQTLLAWLAYFPGDLEARFLLGEVQYKSNNFREAARLASQICETDPEHFPAWELLLSTIQSSNEKDFAVEPTFALDECYGTLAVLKGNKIESQSYPEWAGLTISADEAVQRGRYEDALKYIHRALLTDPLPVVISVRHINLCYLLGLPQESIMDLAEHYHQRFPTCLVHQLIRARLLLDSGKSAQAVAILHEAASQDVTGQVITRLWGADHPFKNLWPEIIKAPLLLSIPADVSISLGWNFLPDKTDAIPKNTGEVAHPQFIFPGQGLETRSSKDHTSDPRLSSQEVHSFNRSETLPENLRSVQTELERIAARLKQNQIARADGRYPVYVILSTLAGLENQFGPKQTRHLIQEMYNLATVIKKKPDWNAIVVLVDDEASLKPYGLEPVQVIDPWKIKLLITDLDKNLEKKGEMIGAVLIVGGPEIVPYHHLPNPVDDHDPDVPSDNPYATRDENYFIPEWPVGRLPGGDQVDSTPLLNLLKTIVNYHADISKRNSWLHRFLSQIRNSISRNRTTRSIGYTAAIWRRASLSVFRPIGDPHSLLVSPPVQVVDDLVSNKQPIILQGRLSYFNLHGVQDSAEWFGQKDPSEPVDHPDYPVALRPQDVVNGGRAPQIVFSEACYGAHIINKTVEEALALKFLSSGSQCFVGSTCTSYGSITTPLIAADLLGHTFWKYVKEGIACGEALRRAKIHLAKEMNRRQGYLDGEDQKTLISFIYFGDPLVQIKETIRQGRTVFRPISRPMDVKTVCEHGGTCLPAGTLSSSGAFPNLPEAVDRETIKQVKQIVQKYLPGMLDSSITVASAHLNHHKNDLTCTFSENDSKSPPQFPIRTKVVTLSKRIAQKNNGSKPPTIHYQYLKVTLNGQGKITKLAISR